MSEANAKPRRRRFQFSLRSLLILVTLVAGLLVAWRVYVEPYRRQREAMKLIEELGGQYKTEARSPAWMRRWVEAGNFQDVTAVSLGGPKVSDADLAHLTELTSLQTLYLYKTEVSDAGLAHLKSLTKLKYLNLAHTRVTDAGVEALQRALPNCAIY